MSMNIWEQLGEASQEHNKRVREIMVKAKSAPSDELSTVESLTLGLTGSRELFRKNQEIQKSINDAIGKPLLLGQTSEERRREQLIGTIAGPLMGRWMSNTWGRLVVPLSPVIRWGGAGRIPNLPEELAATDVVLYDLHGVDARADLEKTQGGASISFEQTEAGEVIVGYENILAWDGLNRCTSEVAQYIGATNMYSFLADR